MGKNKELTLRLISAILMLVVYVTLLLLQVSGVAILEKVSSGFFLLLTIAVLAELSIINSKALQGKLSAIYFFTLYILPFILLCQIPPSILVLYLFISINILSIWYGREQFELVHQHQRVTFPSLFIVVGLLSLIELIIVEKEIQLVLWLSAAVFISDALAYFLGKHFGKSKLAIAISPNKTQFGFFAGLFGTSLLMAIIATICNLLPFGESLLLAFVALFFAASGDLIESYLKRLAAVKDSSRLIPGHGGLLDRFDALIGAAPILVFYVFLF